MADELHQLGTRVRRIEKKLDALLAHLHVELDSTDNAPESHTVVSDSTTPAKEGPHWWRKRKSRWQAHGEYVA